MSLKNARKVFLYNVKWSTVCSLLRYEIKQAYFYLNISIIPDCTSALFISITFFNNPAV